MASTNDLSKFLDQLKPGQVSTMLMDMLPDTITYIKDVSGAYLHVNRAFTETMRMEVSEIAGKTDLDLYGAELAETYMQDDFQVCSTEIAILEKAELVTYRPGIVRWYITSKIPLRDRVAKRLNAVASEYEQGWAGRVTQEAGIRLSRALRGVEELRTLDGTVLRSGEARRLASVSTPTRDVYMTPAQLIRKDRDQLVYGPMDLLRAVLAEGEKGLSLQRYKGLGEMNPEQLWETTLDPEARTLLQVTADDLAEADDIFTKLMGDVVEPRREFIQQNALNVEHLDA